MLPNVHGLSCSYLDVLVLFILVSFHILMSELSSGGFNTHRVFKCMYTMYKLFVKIVAFSYILPQKYILKMLHIHNWIRVR